jgi:DNA repair exonuclease SbcCD ATPase subunit
MIEFIAIECQNFLSFQKLPKTSLKGAGLVFVRGRNMDDPETDSNDSGKSNLFNLITWVLFERLAKTGQVAVGDDVVNSKAGSDCWGTVWLERDGKEFEITRSRNRKGIKNSATITGAITAQGKRVATNEEIEKLLGMKYKMFLSSVFWAQGEQSRRLIQLSDAEYKELFDELVGTEDFADKRKKLLAQTNKLATEIAQYDMQISRLIGSIETAQSFLKPDDEPEIAVDFEALRKVWEDICAKYEAWEEVKGNLAAQARIITERTQWITEKDQQGKNVAARLANVDKEYKKKICSQCKQDLKTKEAMAEIKNLKTELEEGMVKISDEKTRLQGEKDTAEKQAQKLSAKNKQLESEYNRLWEGARQLLPEDLQDTDIPTVLGMEKTKRSQDELAEAESKLTALEKNLEVQSRLRLEKQAEVDKLEILKRAYGPAGMKSMRMAIINPLLNQKAEEYSQLLSGGVLKIIFNNLSETKGGEIRERYSVVVEKDAGVNFRLSGGGMITRANLIAAFALDEVRSMMTGKELSLKIYDEPTEGLDASGESVVVELIREKLKGTSFFVSHRSIVGDNLSDQVWTVVRKDNISVLEAR